jgi:hypothetical protein
MMVNDLVKEMWMNGVISAEQMLEHSYYAGTEDLLQALKASREGAEVQQQPNVQGANVNTVQQIQSALRNG